jgi:hypothetical protein
MIPFHRTCKEVSALLIAREDRHLVWQERLALRLHLTLCAACPPFERQVLTMRNAMKQWRNYGGADTGAVPEDNTPQQQR